MYTLVLLTEEEFLQLTETEKKEVVVLTVSHKEVNQLKE